MFSKSQKKIDLTNLTPTIRLKNQSYFNNVIPINTSVFNSNPYLKTDDEYYLERSMSREKLYSEYKKKSHKKNNRDKHNLLKIVNMYMKDEKKALSKLKVSKIFIKHKSIHKHSKQIIFGRNKNKN